MSEAFGGALADCPALWRVPKQATAEDQRNGARRRGANFSTNVTNFTNEVTKDKQRFARSAGFLLCALRALGALRVEKSLVR
jgi:hypothetical protein